jgi:hypothetical protein
VAFPADTQADVDGDGVCTDAEGAAAKQQWAPSVNPERKKDYPMEVLA